MSQNFLERLSVAAHKPGMEQLIQTTSVAETVEVQEDRRERRQRVLKSGRIVINDAASTINVVIKDLSASGARLNLVDPWILPAEFSLVILNTNTSVPEKRACRRCWQKGNSIGVQFIEIDPVEEAKKRSFFAN